MNNHRINIGQIDLQTVKITSKKNREISYLNPINRR